VRGIRSTPTAGSAMTSKSVAFLLADLGITKTHSRTDLAPHSHFLLTGSGVEPRVLHGHPGGPFRGVYRRYGYGPSNVTHTICPRQRSK
jgi:hypothetical protein